MIIHVFVYVYFYRNVNKLNRRKKSKRENCTLMKFEGDENGAWKCKKRRRLRKRK